LTPPDEAGLSACAVSDAMSQLGMRGTISRLSAAAYGPVAAGPAYTVRFSEGGSGAFNDYLPTVPAGSVVVIDAAGRTDVSAWGGIISAEAQRLGVRATVINGACRDVAELGQLGYQVFAISSTPTSGRGVMSSDEVEVPVTIEGVPVRPGDLVVADADGTVVVPQDRADEVLTLARRITERDEALYEMVRSGTSLSDARLRLP
jgi:4-hydroxy-4-methyl-2-oxoglutarate aldolase